MLRYVDIVIEFILEGDYFEKYEFNDILIYDKKNTELREFIFHIMISYVEMSPVKFGSYLIQLEIHTQKTFSTIGT